MNIIGKLKRLMRGVHSEWKLRKGGCTVVSMSGGRMYNGQLYHSNWGDDINLYFLDEIVRKPIMLLSDLLFSRGQAKNYLVIGSILGLCDTESSIVWGSGILDVDRIPNIKARDIRAVRGPLTRHALMEAGLDCPEVYGDPALLLPLYYTPKGEKRYRLGIVPQYDTIEDFKRFEVAPDIKIISTRGYKDWHDFIDQIVSCEYIVSMSLHGLIVAEAYGVPSKWVEVRGGVLYSHFKYHDFYSSVGKPKEEVMVVDGSTTVDQLIDAARQNKPGEINLQPLIDACPFEISLK